MLKARVRYRMISSQEKHVAAKTDLVIFRLVRKAARVKGRNFYKRTNIKFYGVMACDPKDAMGGKGIWNVARKDLFTKMW